MNIAIYYHEIENTPIDQIKNIPSEQIPVLVARTNYLDSWINYNNEHWRDTDTMNVTVK